MTNALTAFSTERMRAEKYLKALMQIAPSPQKPFISPQMLNGWHGNPASNIS